VVKGENPAAGAGAVLAYDCVGRAGNGLVNTEPPCNALRKAGFTGAKPAVKSHHRAGFEDAGKPFPQRGRFFGGKANLLSR